MHGLYRAPGCPGAAQDIDGAWLPQSGRCRKQAGIPRGSARQQAALSIQRERSKAMSHHYSGPDFGFPRGDARLDFTDLYVFPKPGNASKSSRVRTVPPSAVVTPPGPTPAEPFAPEALYEFRIDTNGDAVADVAYRVRFSAFENGSQTAALHRVDGAQAAG